MIAKILNFFSILFIMFEYFIHNYFNGSIKLFSDVYLIKFLDNLKKII